MGYTLNINITHSLDRLITIRCSINYSFCAKLIYVLNDLRKKKKLKSQKVQLLFFGICGISKQNSDICLNHQL